MYPDQFPGVRYICQRTGAFFTLALEDLAEESAGGAAQGQRGHPAADKIISGIQLYFFRTDPESGRRESRYVPL